jgi:hypothetical protein
LRVEGTHVRRMNPYPGVRLIMARRRDVPCAAGCGRLLWGGGTSKGGLPAGQHTCADCRKRGLGPHRVTLTCEACGKRHPFVGGRSRPKLCPSCRPRLCVICGVEFKRTYNGQRTCGPAHGAELKKLNREKASTP